MCPPPDEMSYECTRCGGLGYTTREGHGHIGYAAPCDCSMERGRAARERRAMIPDNFQGVTLENYKVLREANPVMGDKRAKALQYVKLWVRNYLGSAGPGGQKGLLVTGPTGSGKTHLATAAMRAVLDRGFECVFYDYQTLIKTVAKSWNRDAGSTERETFGMAVETELLVIDDLGASRSMEWAEDIITDIITTRYNAKKPVIVTTNLLDPAIHSMTFAPVNEKRYVRTARSLAEVIGERSRSRLIEMCSVLDMGGIEDYRVPRIR